MSTQLLAIVLILNVVATIILWRMVSRQPSPNPAKDFLRKLTQGAPITPQHEPPKIAGGDWSSLANDDDRRFFFDFAEFADVVNWWLADKHVGSRWRLQELPDGDLGLFVTISSGPVLGRGYAIFHNQVRLGTLEIHPHYPYGSESPKVSAKIEINSVLLLDLDNITDFLYAIASHVCDSKQRSEDDSDVRQAIAEAVMKSLWQTQQITEFDDTGDQVGLKLHIQGLVPRFYFNRRNALRQIWAGQR